MARIRNLLPGILHVPGANLKLQPRAVVDVADITPDIRRQIDAGRIEIVTGEQEAPVTTEPELPEPPPDFEKLDETDAIEYVEDEDDPKVIRSILNAENRPSVMDALKTRLAEIGNDDN